MLDLTKKELNYSLGLLSLLRKGPNLGLDFPALVEVQTINRCNASCAICPYSETTGRKELQKMSSETFDNLLKQLAQEKNFQILVMSFQNEPFVDEDLIEKARKFKELMPTKTLEIVTNGNLLNEDKIAEVYKYFDRVNISVNAHSKGTYEKVMKGLHWEALIENLAFISTKKEWINKTIIRFIKQKENIKEQRVFKKYWNKKGFMVFSFDINSRLDSIANYKSLKIPEGLSQKVKKGLLRAASKVLVKTCAIPFISFYIRANGDVVLCFNDYTDENILGNMKDNSIREIFNSEKYKQIRQGATQKNVLDNQSCRKCDLYKDGIWLTV